MDSNPNYRTINKALWTERTKHHINTAFYNLDEFKKGATSLDEIALNLLPDVKGKEVLHLQCHFGQDTLSLARMGAHATGLDFADESIRQAEALNMECGLDAKFICSDVYDAAQQITNQADLVFTTYGVLGWLPDMKRWAHVVSDCLKPGGELLLIEFHPVVWMFDNAFTKIEYPYFNVAPIIENEDYTYTDSEKKISLPSISWNHPLTDVLSALLAAGLEITLFKEYDYSPYSCFQNIVEIAPSKWQIKDMEGKLPMVYAIKARKPETR